VLVLPGDRYTEEKQTDLETENINSADNGDITKSQARDTMHR